MAVAVSSNTCRARVAELGERWAHSQYDLVLAAVALDDSGEWAADGMPSCAHWIADRLDLELSTAREWLRIGRALQRLPLLAERFAARRLSYSKIRTLTRAATPTNEADLADLADRVPASRLTHAIATYLARTTSPDETQARQHAARALRWHLEPDGSTRFTLTLPPLPAAQLQAAIDTTLLRGQSRAAAEARRTGAWPSIAQQRADAFVALLNSTTRQQTEVVVHVRGDGCTLHDGTPLDDHTVARLLDTAFIRLLVHDAEQRPVNASARRRHPTTRQQRVAHEAGHGQCNDCGRTDLLQYDHDPDYDASRRTHTDELTLRCAPCHNARHRRQAR